MMITEILGIICAVLLILITGAFVYYSNTSVSKVRYTRELRVERHKREGTPHYYFNNQ